MASKFAMLVYSLHSYIQCSNKHVQLDTVEVILFDFTFDQNLNRRQFCVCDKRGSGETSWMSRLV